MICDQEVFTYGVRNNPLSRTLMTKPSSAGAALGGPRSAFWRAAPSPRAAARGGAGQHDLLFPGRSGGCHEIALRGQIACLGREPRERLAVAGDAGDADGGQGGRSLRAQRGLVLQFGDAARMGAGLARDLHPARRRLGAQLAEQPGPLRQRAGGARLERRARGGGRDRVLHGGAGHLPRTTRRRRNARRPPSSPRPGGRTR